jgi:hypothetical protein
MSQWNMFPAAAAAAVVDDIDHVVDVALPQAVYSRVHQSSVNDRHIMLGHGPDNQMVVDVDLVHVAEVTWAPYVAARVV